MRPIHLLIAAFIVTAFAFIAYRGGETPVQASVDAQEEPSRIVQQRPKIE